MEGSSVRWLNVLLGAWLFISTWVWPHTQAQATNAIIVGALVVLFAIIAVWAPQVRYANTALAIWLFISAFALVTQSPATRWNHVLVAIAIFFVSLMGTQAMRPRTV
jgi:hypothetical protein